MKAAQSRSLFCIYKTRKPGQKGFVVSPLRADTSLLAQLACGLSGPKPATSKMQREISWTEPGAVSVWGIILMQRGAASPAAKDPQSLCTSSIDRNDGEIVCCDRLAICSSHEPLRSGSSRVSGEAGAKRRH